MGFEVLFPSRDNDGYHFEGHATAVEAGEVWSVRYRLTLDASWVTRAAHVVGRSTQGAREVRLEGDGTGAWRVDGKATPRLDGCLDVDLEASVCTNALPIHRLKLDMGQQADAPAAYVRASDLRVERLEQHYARLQDVAGHSRYDYTSPDFNYRDVLVYDEFGLVLDYPGITVRVS